MKVAIIIFIVLLVVLSCLFSGNETSVTTLKPYQWLSRKSNDTNKVRNKCVLKILNNYSMALGSILIGNTISNIVCSSLVTLLVERYYSNAYVALATGILTLFVLIFCEYWPKTWAKRNAIKWMSYFWWTIISFYYLLWPLCKLFQKIFERDEKPATASENDVNYLVKTIQQEGILERDEASLVNNALKFDDTPISSIMIRRFASLSTNDTAQQVRNKFIKTNYSRMPVLNSKGNAVGFVLSKDILRDFVYDYDSIQNFSLDKYIKTLHTITCADNLDDALRIMQRTNTHMLGVINSKKHRKLSGIVTMETVIEQLVGKIYDEKDKVNDIQAINSFTWIVDPDVNAASFFNQYLGLNLSNKKITMETFLKRTFKFKHNIKGSRYRAKKFSATVVGSQKGKTLKYEITKI